MNQKVEILEDYIEVDGGNLYVRTWVPHDAATLPPVFLLHDSIGCVEMWRQFPMALCKTLNRRVIAYDRLGFGRSTARIGLPSVHFVAEEAEMFFPVLKARLCVGDFACFGHSVGGGMAVSIAANFPDSCRVVITESSQAFVEPITLQSIAAGKTRFAQPAELAKLERFHGNKARWVVDAWTDTWLSPDFANWSLKPALSRVTCPLLAIHGDHDEYGTIAFPDTLASVTSGGGQKLILKDCGHVPHREKEAIVLSAVRKFLSDAQFCN